MMFIHHIPSFKKQIINTEEEGEYYRRGRQVGPHVLLTLIWMLRCLPDPARAAANRAELA